MTTSFDLYFFSISCKRLHIRWHRIIIDTIRPKIFPISKSPLDIVPKLARGMRWQSVRKLNETDPILIIPS